MQIFRPGANTVATLLLASLGVIPVLAVGFTYQIAGSPYITNAEPYRRSAGTIQSRTSCRRPGTRLPLLSLVGREGALCGAAADRNLHDLPFPDLDECRDAGAGAGEFGRKQAYPLAARQPTSGLRLLRPFGPCRKGRRLYDLSWTDPADEADPPGRAPDHAVVPGLPPRSGQIIRAREAVFDTSWTAPADAEESGRKLMADYHIETSHLTDCSICHR